MGDGPWDDICRSLLLEEPTRARRAGLYEGRPSFVAQAGHKLRERSSLRSLSRWLPYFSTWTLSGDVANEGVAMPHAEKAHRRRWTTAGAAAPVRICPVPRVGSSFGIGGN